MDIKRRAEELLAALANGEKRLADLTLAEMATIILAIKEEMDKIQREE